MIAAAPILTDLFLSVAALIGLGVLHHVISGRGAWDPLNRRFLFGLRITMLLFAARALAILTGAGVFHILVLIGAAMIPVAVLILTEGLLRRHAPPVIKAFIGVGTVAFILLILWPGMTTDRIRLYALLAFQVGGLLAAGFMVLTRDTSTLSTSENRAVGRLGFSLILLIPLAAADFLSDVIGLPIQMSGLGVLFLCWLSISLGRQEAGHRGALTGFAVVVGAAGVAAVLLALMGRMDRDGMIMTLAVVTAAMLTASVYNEARALRSEEQSLSLLRQLAGNEADATTYLRSLQGHPLVAGAAFIDGDGLADLDPTVLRQIFTVTPVLRRADPPFTFGAEGDHVSHLFSRFDATHILLIRPDPLWLVALSMPTIMASDRAELELQAVQRMAALLAKADDATG